MECLGQRFAERRRPVALERQDAPKNIGQLFRRVRAAGMRNRKTGPMQAANP
jgi:hypothetical protein